MTNDKHDDKSGAKPDGDAADKSTEQKAEKKTDNATPAAKATPQKPEAQRKPEAEGKATGERKPPAAKKKSSGGGWLLAVLLLLIVLGALGAGGWYGWQWLKGERAGLLATSEQQSRQADELRQQIERLQAQVERLDETRASADELNELRENISGEQVRLDDRMERIAEDMETLRDAARGGQRDLARSEVEYLLRLAADELYLTRDVDTALYALQTADTRLRDLGDPRLMPVRQLIADHEQALRTVALPDVSGMAMKLGSLTREISKLPLNQAQHAREVSPDEVRESEQGRWWERVRSGVSRLFDKLVVVQRATPPAPLLTPEEHFFLYRNVELQLTAARAALLAGDAASYRQSLELAREWLTRYFDQDDAAVQSAIKDISGLLSVSLQPSLPDITPALERFRAITENAGNK